MNAHASASAGSSRSSRSNFGPSSNHPASIVKQIMTAYRVGYKDPQGCQHAPLKDRIFSGDPAIDTDCKVWLIADAYKQCDSWETFCSRYQISEATNTMEKLLTAVVKHYRQCTSSFLYLAQPYTNTHHLRFASRQCRWSLPSSHHARVSPRWRVSEPQIASISVSTLEESRQVQICEWYCSPQIRYW